MRPKGYRMSQISIEKCRQAKLGKKRPEITGALNPNWKGDNITDCAGHYRAIRMYPCPKGKEHHHIDGNPKNNDPNNIEFLSHKEHMIKDGRLAKLIEHNKQPRLPLSMESRQKIAKARLGTKTSLETRKKLSQIWKAMWVKTEVNLVKKAKEERSCE